MGLGDVTEEAVRRALAEYDELGHEEFLAAYGFEPARRPVLVYEGREFDSKAIVGAAHGYATGTPLKAEEFSDSAGTVLDRLQQLGFDTRDHTRAPRKRPTIAIGEVSGVPVGTTFASRIEAAEAGVHRPRIAGICGTADRGAESIVVSGGYEDDRDEGDVIVYTGHGGQENGKQVRDQDFAASGNAALIASMASGAPVRVIRGAHRNAPPHAPVSGYRYDGLFSVVDAWRAPGKSGFQVCQYRLIKFTPDVQTAPDTTVLNDAGKAEPAGNARPGRRSSTAQRVVRSTDVVEYVKRLHDHQCQACGTRLTFRGRGYSEGAHIRGLGKPHNGPDVVANVLCLCPNCHVLFDNGGMVIDEQLRVVVNGTVTGNLRCEGAHGLDLEHVKYHRERYS